MSHRIRVFIADDHEVVVRGIRDILAEHQDIDVVGATTDGHTLIRDVCATVPHVILLDVKMPNFNILDAIGKLTKTPHVLEAFGGNLPNVILVTSHLDAYLAQQAYDAGIAGYLLKEDALSERLPSTIRTISGGGWAYSEAVQYLLTNTKRVRHDITLGGDQFAILCLMVEGFAVAEIASSTGKTEDCVRRTQSRIRQKLRVTSNSGAITKAIQERIVPLARPDKLAIKQPGTPPAAAPHVP